MNLILPEELQSSFWYQCIQDGGMLQEYMQPLIWRCFSLFQAIHFLGGEEGTRLS